MTAGFGERRKFQTQLLAVISTAHGKQRINKRTRIETPVHSRCNAEGNMPPVGCEIVACSRTKGQDTNRATAPESNEYMIHFLCSPGAMACSKWSPLIIVISHVRCARHIMRAGKPCMGLQKGMLSVPLWETDSPKIGRRRLPFRSPHFPMVGRPLFASTTAQIGPTRGGTFVRSGGLLAH